MPLGEDAKVKEKCKITDAADNTLVTNLITESDNAVVDEVYRILKNLPNIKTLPIIDITAGTVNGSTAPQSLKDACTNGAVSAYKGVNGDLEAATFWEKKRNAEIAKFIEKQTVDNGVYAVIID